MGRNRSPASHNVIKNKMAVPDEHKIVVAKGGKRSKTCHPFFTRNYRYIYQKVAGWQGGKHLDALWNINSGVLNKDEKKKIRK